jgi:hypothetical protein
MKKLLVISLLLATTATHADELRFVSSDNTDLSAMCVAATESRAAFLDAAKAHGLRSSDFNTLYCNGMPLDRFVARYRKSEQAADTRYVFSKNDETPLTELCLAALYSNETYQQMKQQYFPEDSRVGEELKCNGMPVENFVRRYRDGSREFTAAIQ